MNIAILADPKERAAEREADPDWNDYVITEVETSDDPAMFYVTVGDTLFPERRGMGGWTTGMPWPITPEPRKGMLIRVWSNGSQNHGVTLIAGEEGRYDPPIPVYYKTKRERDAEWGYWVVSHQNKQREEFASRVVQLDEAYEALHPVLKRRIDRFRAEDPDFRWKEEAYEMASCSEGTRLYNAAMDPATGKILKDAGIKIPKDLKLKSYEQPKGQGVTDWEDTPENRLIAIDEINGAPNNYNYKLMEKLFPWIDHGHSGNTWGHAVMFARLLIRDGEEAKL